VSSITPFFAFVELTLIDGVVKAEIIKRKGGALRHLYL
jgi:hypothetical protein